MIRRNVPLGSDTPTHWLLIPQTGHARLSRELGEAWRPALLGDGRAAANAELLSALEHHDDGWAAWWAEPGIDRESGAPHAFTEMPPEDAQRLWTASIDACREHGLLAGWVVAAHFSTLQSKRDGDWPEWRSWIKATDRLAAAWLAEWKAADPAHTDALAERSLAWLQRLDWASLWLCCKCVVTRSDAVPAPLEIASADTGDAVHFAPAFDPDGVRVTVSPWPFDSGELTLSVDALRVSVGRYADAEALHAAGEPTTLAWRLKPTP